MKFDRTQKRHVEAIILGNSKFYRIYEAITSRTCHSPVVCSDKSMNLEMKLWCLGLEVSYKGRKTSYPISTGRLLL